MWRRETWTAENKGQAMAREGDMAGIWRAVEAFL